VPFGVVGARLYHVVSSPDAYFGPGGEPLKALRIWEGGLGIWGAVALGAVGGVIGCRRAGVKVAPFADAVAPGVLIAQAIGRLGNWFNQELFGRPTDLPWALAIDPSFRPVGYEQFETFHPAFLYEMLWNVAAAVVLLWADRRFRLGHGRVFWGWIALYTVGRLWIEALRIDDAERVLGLRLNIWTSVAVCLLAVAMFVRSARRNPGREESVLREDSPPPSEKQEVVGSSGPQEPSVPDEPGDVKDQKETSEATHPGGQAEDPPRHP
jgi:prolipoprotein diacylglyceryl transferase